MTGKNPEQTLAFQAEVKQLLHLVTHSLYSNKEIFLRELISNSSDALDRLRFEALSNSALYEEDSELKIWTTFDTKNHTVTVKDNGIGMDREEIIANLGTIAKSGTKEFLRALSGDKAKDANLIGQFGVGFYSSFVVSDKVMVKSRRAGQKADQGVLWLSDGTGEYTICNIEKPARGTEVILHLKKDEDEFLTYWKLKNIINKYSDHILFPILMVKPPEDDAKEKSQKDAAVEFEMVNRATALWTLPKKDIKPEEYNDLYKHISHDFEDPLLYAHNRVEGKLEYISLLYIPQHAPFDLWQRDKKYGLKLYTQRVFIMDDAENLLPNYLRFVRGIIDSKDLPLNVSREILQNNKVIEAIRGGITKRVLDMLEKLAQDDKEKYAKFWQAFGQVLKEGPAEDYANRERIAKLLRFASTKNDSAEQNVALDDYLSRCEKSQDKIYYITADSFLAAKNSPHLEIFRKKNIEVLLLIDRIDEWLVAHLNEYQGKKLQSVAKGNIDLSGTDDKAEKDDAEKTKPDLSDVTAKMKTALGEKVKDVRTSTRLTESPACLIADDSDMSIHLQRIIRASGQPFPTGKPILEINPDHPLIARLKAETVTTNFNELTEILFGQALLAEGGQLENPAEFVKLINRYLIQQCKEGLRIEG